MDQREKAREARDEVERHELKAVFIHIQEQTYNSAGQLSETTGMIHTANSSVQNVTTEVATLRAFSIFKF